MADSKKKKLTIAQLIQKKADNQKITMVTAYDYSAAILAEKAEIDTILVGDSLGMVVLGYESTAPVTMDEMIYHGKIVRRGAPSTFLIVDMPFMSYQVSISDAIANAGRIIKQTECECVKIEGGLEMVPVVDAIVKAGIPVCFHIGLTPQTATKLSGFKVQGKDAESAKELIDAAKKAEAAGACMIVVECVPETVGKRIAMETTIPVIGIGAGKECDGQVLVYHDLLGLFDKFTPKFVKKYADLGTMAYEALSAYKKEVETGLFPGAEHTFKMNPEEEKNI